jgi:ACS family glucarate transporter-like MFS transporter
MQATNPQVSLTDRRSVPRARWWLIAPILLLFVIINQIDKSNISVLIADSRFVADMGATGQPARLGFISSSFFVGYGLSLLLWGFIVDRIGPRRSALWGVLGWAVTTVWCGLAGGLTELYVARFALGLAEGCMWPVCNTYVGRWFAEREHGRIQTFWFNGAQIGIAIGLPVVTGILLAAGWHAVFFVCGAASVGILLPLFYWLAPDEPAQSRWVKPAELLYVEKSSPAPPKASSAKLRFLVKPAFWLIALCQACLVATFFGLNTWIPTYLTKARGLPFGTMSVLVASAYLVPVALALAVAYASDHTRLPRAAVGAIASVVMAVMILAAVVTPSTIVSMLLLVISMAAPITYGAMNTSIMHRLAPPEQIGRATGIFVGVGNVLGAAGPAIVGWLIGVFHGEYLAAFGFISALNLAQAILYLLVARKDPSRLT